MWKKTINSLPRSGGANVFYMELRRVICRIFIRFLIENSPISVKIRNLFVIIFSFVLKNVDKS